MIKLFGYFRSSAAYRVRIALNFKQIEWESAIIHLTKDGGEQFSEAYKRVNPQSLLPTLEDEEIYYTQSIAILEYLEEKYPNPPLLPNRPKLRAHARALALAIACDIHPINNLRVLHYLTQKMKFDDTQKLAWYQHWIAVGFTSIEAMLARSPDTGEFCCGDKVSLADICLVPQVFNAKRFSCDLSGYPIIKRINETCLQLKQFETAAPDKQKDAE